MLFFSRYICSISGGRSRNSQASVRLDGGGEWDAWGKAPWVRVRPSPRYLFEKNEKQKCENENKLIICTLFFTKNIKFCRFLFFQKSYFLFLPRRARQPSSRGIKGLCDVVKQFVLLWLLYIGWVHWQGSFDSGWGKKQEGDYYWLKKGSCILRYIIHICIDTIYSFIIHFLSFSDVSKIAAVV